MSYPAPESGSRNQTEPLPAYSEQPQNGQPTAVLSSGDVPSSQSYAQAPAGQPWGQSPEPFVPKKRFKMGRLTTVLLAILLVAVGFFSGVGVTKFMDAQARPGRGQFQNFNGGQGRNRQSGAPTNGASPRAVPSAPATSAP
ncbi:hypothetical protein AB6813_15845 [bacterium RCC_150]